MTRLTRVRDASPSRRPQALRALAAQGDAYAMGLCQRSGRGIELVDLFYRPGSPLAPHAVRTAVPPECTEVPSAVAALPRVHWDEREIRDLFGLSFAGHPDDRRLLLPDPRRTAIFSPRPVPPWHPRVLKQRDAVHVPVGPVHAGIIESGQFHFSIMGETVLQMDARLFWNHRGIEAALEGLGVDEAVTRVERICASCTVSHQAALAMAVESLAGLRPPARTEAVRLVLLELERLASHLNDLAQLAAGAALQVLLMQGMALRERLLAVQHRHFGHRYLFGTIRPAVPAPTFDAAGLAADLGPLLEEAAAWMERLFAHQGFRDRLTGVGRLSPEQVTALGGVGPAARATGIAADLRRDLPYGFYPGLVSEPAVRTAGDAMARAEVRQLEVLESWRLVREVLAELDSLPDRASAVDAEPLDGAATGYSESPRGASFHYVRMRAGRITRYHVRSASFANWPLVMVASADNPIGDFPLINKSFELCYACCDR